jgi:4-hydroxybenzoate polyprenyltransferase
MTNIARISRPRFWVYVFGPYLVGIAAGAMSASDFIRFDSILFAIYFLLPANLLIYGINDIFDFETDSVNPKKRGYESLVGPARRRGLITAIALFNLPFLIAACILAPKALPSLAAFLFFSVLYSAPPVRAKAVPIFDSIFNILYVFPGAFAYQMLTGSFPPAWTIVAASLWTAAMHAYSAIPDIKADTKAGLDTIATLLGRGWTHGFCIVCFCVASIIAAGNGSPASVLGLLYIGLMRWSDASTSDAGVFRVYKIFPWVNAIAGFLIFMSIAWPKFF